MQRHYIEALMQRFSIRPSLLSVVFYLLLLTAWVFVIIVGGKDYWYAGLAPWYGLGLILLIKGTRYRIKEKELVVRNPFEKRIIPLTAINRVEEIHNPFWKRMFTGFPPYSIRLTYEEQQTLIHANKPETMRSLLASFRPRV
jgi:hypothetical protein